MNKDNESQSFWIIISEILFAFMPLIVLIFITIMTDMKFEAIFKRSDLSFISVLFFGQTLVRFISGIAKSSRKLKWHIIAFFISIVFLFGVIPSILILAVIFLEINTRLYIYIMQVIWLSLSLLTYFIMGRIGQMYLNEK